MSNGDIRTSRGWDRIGPLTTTMRPPDAPADRPEERRTDAIPTDDATPATETEVEATTGEE